MNDNKKIYIGKHFFVNTDSKYLIFFETLINDYFFPYLRRFLHFIEYFFSLLMSPIYFNNELSKFASKNNQYLSKISGKVIEIKFGNKVFYSIFRNNIFFLKKEMEIKFTILSSENIKIESSLGVFEIYYNIKFNNNY